MTFRIFLSHSAGDVASDALVEELTGKLGEDGHDVLLDSAILHPGDEWRDELALALGLCQGAVVLLAEPALDAARPWVLWETGILVWRQILDPDFVIVPVLMPGIDLARLEGHPGFREFRLQTRQTVSHGDDSAETARAIAARFQAGSGAARSTPVDELIDQVHALLENVGDHTVAAAARRLDLPAVPWTPQGDPRRALALGLLDAPIDESVDALEYILERTTDTRAIARILELTLPGWVDLRAAHAVARSAREPGRKRALIVNAESGFAAEMYVRRASAKPPNTSWRTIAVRSVHGENTLDDLAAEIKLALGEHFGDDIAADDPFDEIDPDAAVAELVGDLDARGHPTVIVMKRDRLSEALVEGLRSRFPHLTFLFLSGAAMPDEAHCPVPACLPVLPALEGGIEQAARSASRRARAIVRPGVR
jgi:hypothetical protein